MRTFYFIFILVGSANQIVGMISIRLTFALAIIVVIFAFSVNAAYKKPPFNGSIFGKRSNTVTGKYNLFINCINNTAFSKMCSLKNLTLQNKFVFS